MASDALLMIHLLLLLLQIDERLPRTHAKKLRSCENERKIKTQIISKRKKHHHHHVPLVCVRVRVKVRV